MLDPVISVCINHKNRSFYERSGEMVPLFRRSFDALIESLDSLSLPYEVVIADWPDEQTARLGLGVWVKHPCVRVIDCVGTFTRGEGRQIAAANAVAPILYFMDADMLTPVEVLRRGIDIVHDGKAFFPLYVRQARYQSDSYTDGIGTGNAIVSRVHHEQSCGYPSVKGWGGEDTAYCHWYKSRDLMIREQIKGYIHQWHPGEG